MANDDASEEELHILHSLFILNLTRFLAFSYKGNPLYSDAIGKMCFNGSKSWQIGWYNDRKVMLNPKALSANNPSWSTVVTLVGVADYQNVANIPVVLKLETDTVNDYFIAFNRASGINADNEEADDEVTIVLTGNNGESQAQSYLKATLLVGEQYAIAKFGGGARTCVIKLVSIDKLTSVWKANIEVTTFGAVSLLLDMFAGFMFRFLFKCSEYVNETCLHNIDDIYHSKLPPTFKPTSSKPTITSSKPTSLKPTSLKPTTLKPTTASATFNVRVNIFLHSLFRSDYLFLALTIIPIHSKTAYKYGDNEYSDYCKH